MNPASEYSLIALSETLIRVFEYGEFASECLQGSHVKVGASDSFVTFFAFCGNVAVRVYDHGMSVVFAGWIIAYAVHADYVTLILYGARLQKRVPCSDSN
jgi:hypothetical protein